MRVALIGVPDRMARKLPGFDVVLLDEVVSHEFDPRTDMWTVTAPNGRTTTARVIVTTFPVTGPNAFRFEDGNFRYIARCLRMMGLQDARRIEVQPHARISYRRKPDPHDYIFTPYESELDETHRGPAVLTVDGAEIDVEVHLMGHLQPIDGSYRWYGRITAHPDVTALYKRGHNDVTVRLPGGSPRRGRLAELDPWGNARITGTGRPPFPYP
ncbi:DUF4873 domain-containing protein [Kibdelosporangium persicum]|uniref:Flavin binding monooxygenase n=1 Tax=Kibdelosporangium persicum TaxID=2698649 RepID=A0ABX2EX65_9PSEU|nr:DUF4873 domain-containing protein [Kibdelosporangium persicum]NRN63300.1 putative flavin binding monooxygenase [Kibdelosporangium persicum]